MTEQPASPPDTDLVVAEHADEEPQLPRRQPGDPHPYMLQRNPPNLWILVAMTVFALTLTVFVMVLTVLL